MPNNRSCAQVSGSDFQQQVSRCRGVIYFKCTIINAVDKMINVIDAAMFITYKRRIFNKFVLTNVEQTGFIAL